MQEKREKQKDADEARASKRRALRGKKKVQISPCVCCLIDNTVQYYDRSKSQYDAIP